VSGEPSRHSVFVDHYRVLEVAPGASSEEIRRAFRRLALLRHPDHIGGDGLQFLELYSAYQVLSDPQARLEYDRIYAGRQRAIRERDTLFIPGSRLKFPGAIANLARRGLLSRKFRSRDRKFYLNVDYDLELQLTPREQRSRIAVDIPVVVRVLCPDCRGSDPQCEACDGRGTYKASRPVRLTFEGGLTHGQIIEVNLSGLRPGPLSHSKRKKLRLRIATLPLRKAAGANG